ncbi:hypothetical protein HO345_08070 [Treponema denticola]|uniref:hypothetical protein n=1 Tax=Treponema denticola TaxID=158 RepID=UPI0020A330A7|nr:hypothetical protein [Treponema denticola]UTD11466.1 hypothetical protein HO345_08070 [Treponema denticola]
MLTFSSSFFKMKKAVNGHEVMINSSAEIQPHCLSDEFAFQANIALLYAVFKKPLEKTFFGS